MPMRDDADPLAQLAETRKTIERDAQQLRGRWRQVRTEAAESFSRFAWIGQIGSLFMRRRDRDGGPSQSDR